MISFAPPLSNHTYYRQTLRAYEVSNRVLPVSSCAFLNKHNVLDKLIFPNVQEVIQSLLVDLPRALLSILPFWVRLLTPSFPRVFFGEYIPPRCDIMCSEEDTTLHRDLVIMATYCAHYSPFMAVIEKCISWLLSVLYRVLCIVYPLLGFTVLCSTFIPSLVNSRPNISVAVVSTDRMSRLLKKKIKQFRKEFQPSVDNKHAKLAYSRRYLTAAAAATLLDDHKIVVDICGNENRYYGTKLPMYSTSGHGIKCVMPADGQHANIGGASTSKVEVKKEIQTYDSHVLMVDSDWYYNQSELTTMFLNGGLIVTRLFEEIKSNDEETIVCNAFGIVHTIAGGGSYTHGYHRWTGETGYLTNGSAVLQYKRLYVDYDTKCAVFYLFAVNATIADHQFMKTVRAVNYITNNKVSICSHTVIITSPEGLETKLDMSVVKTLASRIDPNDIEAAPTLFTVLFSHKQDELDGTPAEYIIAAMQYRQKFMDVSVFNYEDITEKVKRVLTNHGISYHALPILTNWLGFKLNTPRSLSEEARLPITHSTGGSTIETTSVRGPPRAIISNSDVQPKSVGSETETESNPTGDPGLDEKISCSNREESILSEVSNPSESAEETVVKDQVPSTTGKVESTPDTEIAKSHVELQQSRSSTKRSRQKRKRSKRPHTESAWTVLPKDCDADKEAAILCWGAQSTPAGEKSYADALRGAPRH